MKIKIIALGKIKEQSLSSLIDEYKKRIGKYTNIEIIELKESNLRSLSDKDICNALVEEAIEINKYIKKDDYVIPLTIEGKSLDSVTFANNLESVFSLGKDIVFIIGSSYGLSDEIKNRGNLNLSFSKMTYPHQLMRLILLEQLFRAFKIIHHETYHK